MPAPEVLDGQRAPRSVRLDDIRKGTASALNALPVPQLAPEGVTVYVSSVRRYLVEVANTRAYNDADGVRIPARRVAAQFEEGVFRNNDHDPAVRALVDRSLQMNKYFGKFGGGPMVHFWLASDQREKTETARIKGALDVLKSLPKEAIAEFLAQGQAEDHTLPPVAEDAPRATQRTTKPIPTVA